MVGTAVAPAAWWYVRAGPALAVIRVAIPAVVIRAAADMAVVTTTTDRLLCGRLGREEYATPAGLSRQGRFSFEGRQIA